jgi:hypothetical protein
MTPRNRVLAAVILPIVGFALATGCGGGESEHSSHEMAPVENMPQAIREAPKPVRDAYSFAVANPEILQQVPCYCGCGGMGHTSNYSCYVSVAPDGTRSFEGHALGCSICVDIALDAMRLFEQGKNVSEIRLYVDVMYSKYGPSNMT